MSTDHKHKAFLLYLGKNEKTQIVDLNPFIAVKKLFLPEIYVYR